MRSILTKISKSFGLYKPLAFPDFVNQWQSFALQRLIITYGQKQNLDSYHYLQVSLENDEQQLGFTSTKGKKLELIKDKRLANSTPYYQEWVNPLHKLTHQVSKETLDQYIYRLEHFSGASDHTAQLSEESKSLKSLEFSAGLLRQSIEHTASLEKGIIQSLMMVNLKSNSLHLKIFNIEFLLVIDQDQMWLELYDYQQNSEQRTLKLRQSFKYLHRPAFDQVLQTIILLNKTIF